jgi:hypothetical protein
VQGQGTGATPELADCRQVVSMSMPARASHGFRLIYRMTVGRAQYWQGCPRHTGDQDYPPPVRRQLGRLSASSNADEAGWIWAAICNDYTVGSIVPPVFDAYARVFHPASRGQGDDKTAVSWTEVARANGREMHPAAEWESITGSWDHQHRATHDPRHRLRVFEHCVTKAFCRWAILGSNQ